MSKSNPEDSSRQETRLDLIPNSYQTPNVLVDKLMPLLTASEWMLVNFAVRCILGYKDKIVDRQARISVSRFQETGLSRPAIINGLKALKEYRILLPIGEATTKGQQWKINFEGDVDFDGLIARQAAKKTTGKKRTDKARSVSLTTGKSDLPQSVNPTDQESVSGTDTYKPNSINLISNPTDSVSAQIADIDARIAKLEALLKERDATIEELHRQLEAKDSEEKKSSAKRKDPASRPRDPLFDLLAREIFGLDEVNGDGRKVAGFRSELFKFIFGTKDPPSEKVAALTADLTGMWSTWTKRHPNLSKPAKFEAIGRGLREYRDSLKSCDEKYEPSLTMPGIFVLKGSQS